MPDAQRRRAFTALRTEVGLDPLAIAAAPAERLERITRLGGQIAAASRASRLRESAELVLGRWHGDLRTALHLPVAEARRALGEFRMIGEPGADRILVYAKKARALPMDSNALRVVQRLGLAPEARDYRSMYRLAQAALAPALPKSYQGLIAASSLLRRHGQELCRRTAPKCGECPLGTRCPSSTVLTP